jgi:hypothetical protein
VAALAAGCGKGNPASAAAGGASQATSATPTPGPAPSPGAPLSSARADAFARAVNLTAADVPGFAPRGPDRTAQSPKEQGLERRLVRCMGGAGGLGRSGEGGHSSPSFTGRGRALDETVSSSVGFAPTAAAAAGELRLLRSSRARACLASYLDLLFTGKRYGGGAIQRVSIVGGTPPAPGTSGGFGWRITAAVAVRGLSAPLYVDILGFVYGPAEVTLMSSGVLVPFPARAEEQLFRLLVARARAHPL